MRSELRHLRQRNREMAAEVKSLTDDMEAVEQHYRTRLQAYSDTCRMHGMNAPSESTVAYWEEAQTLLRTVIELQYGGGRSGLGELSVAELKKVRKRFEQRIKVDRVRVEQANAEVEKLRTELSELRQGGGAGGAAAQKASDRPPSAKGASHPSAPAVPLLVHEAKLRELRSEHDAKMRELRSSHSTALKHEHERVEVEAAGREAAERAKLTSATSVATMELERQLAEVNAAADAKAALEAAKEREARIELLRRQVVRRMKNADLSKGWTAWQELWEARRYQQALLREAGMKLKAPALSSAFAFWVKDHLDAKREAEYKAMLQHSDSLEDRLRYAHYETGQLALIKAAQEDELQGLRLRVSELSSTVSSPERHAATARASAARQELGQLQAMYRDTVEELEDTKKRMATAETEAASQRQSSEALLKRLLAEQRTVFDQEAGELKLQLAAQTEAQEREAVSVCREAVLMCL